MARPFLSSSFILSFSPLSLSNKQIPRPGNQGSVTGCGKTGSGALLASCSMVARKQGARGIRLTIPRPSAEIKNRWICTSASPDSFMVECLVKHRDNLCFAFISCLTLSFTFVFVFYFLSFFLLISLLYNSLTSSIFMSAV
jgi:hypothetical protein